MADATRLAKIGSDRWKMTWNGADFPLDVGVSLSEGMYDPFPILATEYGTTPQGFKVQGVNVVVEITAQTTNEDDIKKFFGLPASAATELNLDPGASLPVHTVKLHDQDMGATEDGDLFLYAAAITSVRRSADGQGSAQWTVRFTATEDANGDVFRSGPAPG